MSKFQTANRLLLALSAAELRLLGTLELVSFALGQPLERRGLDTAYAHFIETGLASVVVTGDDRPAEAGLVGPEGFIATGLVANDRRAAFDSMMQIEGTARRVSADQFLAAIAASSTLRLRLQRYVRALTIQTSYTAWSNGNSVLEDRLARWLLMVSDRVGLTFNITHEYISVMLAVRRSGVTISIQALEGKGYIRVARGQIFITNREGLLRQAGAGYGPPEAEYERLLGPPIVSSAANQSHEPVLRST